MRRFTFAFPQVERLGEQWLEMFRKSLGRFSVVFVAERDGVLLGFILARIKHSPPYLGGVRVGELKDMWVEPETRGLGIGRELLGRAVDWCREQRVHSIEAQVLDGNEPILRLLAGFGLRLELRQLRLSLEPSRAPGK
jgi:GNAT superfamily N-acetyltransferase